MIAPFGSKISTLSRYFGNSVFEKFNLSRNLRSFSILRPPDDDASNQSKGLIENFSDHVQRLQKSPKPSAIAETFWWAFTHQTPLLQSPEFHHLCDLASTLGGSFNPEELTLLFRTSFEKMTKLHIPLLQSLTESLLQSRDLAPFPSVCIINILSSLSKRHRSMIGGFSQDPTRPVLFPSQTEFVELLVLELGMEPRLKQLSPLELFQTVYSSLVLGLANSTLLTPLKNRLSDRNTLESLNCKELAHLGYSLVKSQSSDELRILDDLVKLFGSKALSLGSKKELGLVLFILGKMQKGVKVPTPILTLLKLVNRDLIASLRNEDISCFFYGLGKLGLRDLNLLENLSFEIQKKVRMSQLHGQQILSILTSMKDLDFQDQQLMVSLSREVLVGIDPDSKKPKISNFKYFELCGILHAWSRLGHHKQWAIQVLVNELLKDSRQLEMCATSVGILIHSLGLSSLYDPVILRVLETSWLVPEKLKDLDDGLLVMMIDGLTRLKTVRMFPVLDPVLNEFTKSHRIQNSSTLRIVSCLHSLASLQQIKNPNLVSILVQELNKTHRILQMSERCLSQVIYALGKVKFNQLDFLTPFVVECLKPRRLRSMDNQSISNVLLGLGYIGYPDHSHVRILAWELLKPTRIHSIHEQSYIQLTNLVLTLGLLNVESCESILDQVCSILIKKNAIPVLKAIGLKNLIINLVQLKYKHHEVYRLLIREALERDKRGKLFGKHLSMIFESIGKLGETRLFDELVMWGLRDLQDLKQYSSISLSRFLIGFRSMESTSNRPDLIQRLLKEQTRRKQKTKKQKELKFNKDDFLIT